MALPQINGLDECYVFLLTLSLTGQFEFNHPIADSFADCRKISSGFQCRPNIKNSSVILQATGLD